MGILGEPNNITLQLGDWSHDGHGLTATYSITSSLSIKEINKAYKKGVKKIGVDLGEDICRDYEENFISMQYLHSFIEAGYTSNYFNISNSIDGGSVLTQEEYLQLYLFTVKIGNNKFEYTLVNDKETIIQIGGYGLFGS